MHAKYIHAAWKIFFFQFFKTRAVLDADLLCVQHFNLIQWLHPTNKDILKLPLPKYFLGSKMKE